MSKSKSAWFDKFEEAVEYEDEPSSEPRPEPSGLWEINAECRDGSLHELDVAERSFERDGGQELSVVAEFEENVVMNATQSAKEPEAKDAYPDLSSVTTVKVPHRNLILDGVCSHCAHCGHQLTDAQSIQRGIGPVCSGKGYAEDPVDGDEMQAMIDLMEFPELVEFLNEHYKPLGIRGLVNGLVRVASLNRPRGRGWSEGNADVHAACCDAIESLGHQKLSKLLRETLVIMEVRESTEYPHCLEVWVKKRDWTKDWSWDVTRDVSGTFFSKKVKAMVIPVGNNGKVMSKCRPDGNGPITNKRALWNLMLRHYGGSIAKVKGEAVKIVEKSK